MSEPTATLTKVCPRCAETIKAAAKVCPFCQTRVTWWGLRQQDLVIWVVALAMVGLAAWLLPLGEQSPGREFTPYRSQLVVHQLSLYQTGKRQEFWLSGLVSNRSGYPWRVQQLEVRFLSSQTNLLDVHYPRVENPFVVQPGHEASFRVHLGRLPPAIAQATVTGRVHEATDGNWAPPD